MATTQQPAAPVHKVSRGVQPLRAGEGYSFIWRKLHSLSGIVPIGAFLLEHILSNFEALKGPVAYAQQVKFLNSLPLVRVLEWTFIFIPILYHGCYGVYIWLRGKSNVVYYPWAGNWLYVSQRWTGIISFAYIVQHVLRQRFMGISLPESPGAAFHKVQVELSNPIMLAVYGIAMIAVCSGGRSAFARQAETCCATGPSPRPSALEVEAVPSPRRRLEPRSRCETVAWRPASTAPATPRAGFGD